MFPLLQKLFESTGLLPLGNCYSWQSDILAANVIGDGLIALTYLAAPFVLYILNQRRKVPVHNYVFVVVSFFIWFCALRHITEIVTVWYPIYYLQGILKIITGLLAIATIIVVYRSLPLALGIVKAESLQQVNARLLDEVADRERAQVALRQANEALESRVQQRTSQLIKTNRELEKEIEQRKKTEQNLLEKNKELSRINSELDNFVYHASHDLKDPIVKIEGLVTALKEELPQPTPHVNEIFQHLDGSLLKVDKTVLDLTEVGRIQKSEATDAYEEVHFETICRQVHQDLEDQLKRANATIHSDFSKAPTIYFSAENLKRICLNLMLNALHMRNPARPLKITMATEPAGDHILIRIADTGLGVAEPGSQMPEAGPSVLTEKNQESFGLSLYIVQRILNNCNGQLKIHSVPGQGSSFEVLLPAGVYQS